MKLLKILSICAVVGLSSCASTPQNKFDSKRSYANNIATAANAFVIKDAEVPQEVLGDFTKNGISDLAWIGAAGISPPPGVSRPFSLGITSAALIFGPKDPAGESRVLVWVPKDLLAQGESPRDYTFKIVAAAYAKVAESLGLQAYSNDNKKALGFTSSKDIKKVGENVLLFVLGDPKEVVAPAAAGGKPSYLFTTDPYLDYSSKIVAKDFGSIDEFGFLMKLSAELPEWIVLYIKPEFLKINGETNKFPFMLQNGKMHLFVVPK
ncbi:MAG: hypothetical protein EOO52_12775 [Gammaproteobacteria bacterium]|nr:MAG: hypothetical protein EOO52_12775 [Gammaproteobacteria bacterium]